MADRNLSFRIGAQDDASAVFSKLAKAAKRDLGQVEAGMDDARTAGKKMADALSAVADDLEQELAGTARAADRLGEALGPEIAAKLKDGDLDRFVDDLRTAGLTIDDIEQEADELAAALKRMDDVTATAGHGVRRSFDDVDGSVRRVGETADRTGSVVANAAGNMAQDIGALGGIAGSTGVAIGQFAEYATEGGISMRNFARVAGPLALASIAIAGITKSMQESAKTKAFEREQVTDWTEAVREGSQVVRLLRDQIEQTGKLELPIISDELGGGGGPINWLEEKLGLEDGVKQIEDLLPVLHELGLSVEDFARLTDASGDELETWRARMVDAGHDADTVDTAVRGAAGAQDQYKTATENAAIITGVLGDESETAADKAERLDRQIERNTEHLEARRAKTEEVIDAQRRLSDEEVSQERALLDLADAQDRYRQVQTDSEASDRDRLRAQLDLFDAHVAYGQSVSAAAETNAIAQGNITGAAEAAEQAQIEALLRVTAQLEPGSPLRVRLEEYIGRLHEAEKPRNAVLTITERRLAQHQAAAEAGVFGAAGRSLPGAKTLHSGGEVSPAMAASQRGTPGLGPDEVLAKLQVGEQVVPRGDAGTPQVIVNQTVNGRLTADEEAAARAAMRDAAREVVAGLARRLG